LFFYNKWSLALRALMNWLMVIS